MNNIPESTLSPESITGGAITVAGPWPSYRQFRSLPERERWVVYGTAKRHRQDMEDRGIRMSETYDEFIKRVTDELEI